MAALAEVAEVGRLDDYNAESQEGVAVFQQSVDGGVRYSSSVGYLDDHKLPNLTVATRVVVSRVLLGNGRATGVEVITNEGRRIIRATREVILAAGVFGSPQILMLSGIGPAAHLREHGIDVAARIDRKSTRLNSSHTVISYAVFCLKKKTVTTSTREH